MITDFSTHIQEAIAALLHGPKSADKEFVRGITFGEVYAMAAGLQAAMAEATEETAICLATENKATIAAALLASLASGPAFLLPYAFSAKALLQLQKTCGFTTALADTAGIPEGIRILCPLPGEYAGTPLTPQASPQAELLKIFTGGSTGTPRVWSKTAENIFSEGFFLAEKYDVSEHDCILATIPPHHIYGLLFSVVLPLVSAATVISETPSFPNEIVDVAEDHGATLLAGVPAHYHVLRDKKISLRLAFSSAGMLDREDSEAFYRKNGIGVEEVYGSTETGGIATRNRSTGAEYFTPFPTIDWKIVGGRLAVHSPYVSPDLPVDEDGYFIAGDRVEYKGINHFALKGRADKVTKVGGKRVDLEEISLLIKNEAGVTDCVVIALPESGGRGNRIGTVIQGESIDIDVIRKKLTDSLEPYALPRLIRIVKHMPLSASGKYDFDAIAGLLGNE
ncbi:class I adenylate-forming enzyme family protein [Desulfopila inferna]|uniref:class I adenylate-forming enzyme family protein n=1 Tax=Desulfopila inferna TaxID=468528 RepID=UPI001963376D|nr:fatty acid--CoA ligase family protein [Desulfopila inferna]MBM9604286.1 long-chain fatty acid--CoA ligase [Desulfopila inferna]